MMVGFGDFGASIGGPVGSVDDAMANMTGASSADGNFGFGDFGGSINGPIGSVEDALAGMTGASTGGNGFGLGSDDGISQAAVDFANEAYGGSDFAGNGIGGIEQIDEGLFAVMDDAGGFFADDQGNYLGEIGADSGLFGNEPMGPGAGLDSGFDVGMAPQMADPVSVADRGEIAGYGGFDGLLSSEPIASGMPQDYQSGINPAVMDALDRGSQSASQLSGLMFGGQPVAEMRDTMTGGRAYDGALSGGRMMDAPSLQGMPETGMGARGVQTSPAMGINIGDRELDALGRVSRAEAEIDGRRGMNAVGRAVLNRAASSEFPNTIRGVVEQRPGLEFDVMRGKTSIYDLPAATPQQLNNLRSDMSMPDPTRGATFFQNPTITNQRGTNYAGSRQPTAQIGGHAFYDGYGGRPSVDVPQFTPNVTAGLDQFQPNAVTGSQFANLQGSMPDMPSVMMADVAAPGGSTASLAPADIDLTGFDAAFFDPAPIGSFAALDAPQPSEPSSSISGRTLGGYRDSMETTVSPEVGFVGSAGSANLNPGLVGFAEDVSRMIGRDITVTSGYRDPETNSRVGGASRSAHLDGNAIDIRSRDLSVPEQETVIDNAAGIGFVQHGTPSRRGVGNYVPGYTHIHVDVEPEFSYVPQQPPTPPSRPTTMTADLPGANVQAASFDMPDMDAPMQPVGFDSAFFSPEPMLDMGTGLDIGRSAMPVSEPAPISDVGQALAALNQPRQAAFSMPSAGTSMQGMIGVPSEEPEMAGLYDPEMMGMSPFGMQPRGDPVEDTFNMSQAQSLQRAGPAQFNAFEAPMQASAPERGDGAQFNAFEEPMQFDPPSRPAPDLDAPRTVQTRTITAEPTPARDTETIEIATAEPTEENISRAARSNGIEPETEVAAVDPENPEEEERTTFKDAVTRGLKVTAITGSPVLGLGAGLLSALLDSDMEWEPGTAPVSMGDDGGDPIDANADIRRRIREIEEARRREAEEAEEEAARSRQRTGWNLPGRG